ncbi:hypothetical protein [Marinitoga lauensis]|nr:hypothetical protein [Marinitoga lauensis]
MKSLLDEGLMNPLSLEFKEDDVLNIFINEMLHLQLIGHINQDI